MTIDYSIEAKYQKECKHKDALTLCVDCGKILHDTGWFKTIITTSACPENRVVWMEIPTGVLKPL